MSTPQDNDKARNRRNWAIPVALVAFCVLVFVVTIVKLGGNVRPHF